MSKIDLNEAIGNEWDNLPLYIGYAEIESLGFKKTRIYKWFKRKDFPPMLLQDGKRVNKYKFKKWLEEREEKADESW